MKVIVKKQYKSLLTSTKIADLPDFVIITGENGSGKSQFLNAIFNGAINLTDSNGNQINTINTASEKVIVKQDSISIQQANYGTDHSEDVITKIYDSYINDKSTGIEFFDRPPLNSKKLIDNIKNDLQVHRLDRDIISEWLNKNIYKSLPFETNQLIRVFSTYFRNLVNNLVSRHRGEENLDDNQFIDKYGESPWDILNSILNKKAKLHFKFLTPKTERINPLNILCENDYGEEFSVTDLSSGEKVLLTIAMSVYSAENGQMQIPKIILLDEVDSALHPSMIQNLLSLIEEVFVQEYKIKVIMTTHSPTTVALAKDKVLFYMQSNNENRISQISKYNALKKLAYGIPTLSVTYLNRKYIITESSYDAKNFEDLYTILVRADYLSKDISLNFIPSGLNSSQKSGDCNVVKSIVEGFASNSNVYGIIDWDCTNEPQNNVHVLAYKERYSIENCILDPVLIALLLLHDIRIKVDPEVFGLSSTFNLIKNIDEFDGKLQGVSDAIIAAVKSKLGIDINKTLKIMYAGGSNIDIPTDYLRFQGHDLESKIKEVYPHLNAYHNSNELKQALIKISSIYPQYIPNCFIDIFKSILE